MNPQSKVPGFMVKLTSTSKCWVVVLKGKLVMIKVPDELVIVVLPADWMTHIVASVCPERVWNAANSPAWLLLLRVIRVGPERVACAKEVIPA
jgi:hypothetical protein